MATSEANRALIASLIRDIPDFPKPGVVFKDITPLLASAAGYRAAIAELAASAPSGIDVVVGMEARGFIFAGPVALELGAGFVPVRKPGKLPGDVYTQTFSLEYGDETLAVHTDAVMPGAKVLVIDDVLATGGDGRSHRSPDPSARRGAGPCVGPAGAEFPRWQTAPGRPRHPGHVGGTHGLMAEPRPRSSRRSLWSGGAQVSLPGRGSSAARQLMFRLLFGVGLLLLLTLIVFIDRDAYSDNVAQDGVSFIDALYYATVTMTTTGYGDITPVLPHARLINVFIVTPIRVAFLVLLVGTTVEVLANEGRRALRDAHWRKKMRNHTVVIGYGTTGQSATATLLRGNLPVDRILVIDADSQAVAAANRHGLAAFEGDATSRELLHRAELPKAKEIIITVGRDDTAILATLTVRQLNRGAHVVVAVRDSLNLPLIRQSGADAVVTSSDAVGRLMGLSSISPELGEVIEDLLSAGDGLEVTQRLVTREEDGRQLSDLNGEKVLAVVRNRTLRRYYEMGDDTLRTGDEVVVVRKAPGIPRTPRVE